jgi:hypothetical protein
VSNTLPVTGVEDSVAATVDPTTFIVRQGDDELEYLNTDGKRWRVRGVCNACGLCEVQPETVPSTVLHTNVAVDADGNRYTWERTLNWVDQPGSPDACVESGFELRLDIPMTPDAIAMWDGCTLTGEWL